MTTTRTPTSGRVRVAPLIHAAVALACVGLLAACGDDDDHTAGPRVEESATQTSAPPADDATRNGPGAGAPTSTPVEGDDDAEPTDHTEAAFPADTSPDEAAASDGAMLTVTDVRAAAHDGYDRVVFDLGGTGQPGWRVEYVDAALSDGSGLTVDVAGDEILQVVISGSAYPFDSGAVEYTGANPLDPGLSIVDEIAYDHVFEGYSTAFVGVTGDERPFRAFAMTNPTRLVVDVRSE